MTNEEKIQAVVDRAERVYEARHLVFHDPNDVHRKILNLGAALKVHAGQLAPAVLGPPRCGGRLVKVPGRVFTNALRCDTCGEEFDQLTDIAAGEKCTRPRKAVSNGT